MRKMIVTLCVAVSLLVGVRPADAGPLHVLGKVAKQVGHAFVIGAEAAAVTAAVVVYIAARN